MRYAKARLETEDRDEAYRIYVTDALRAQLRNNEAPRYVDLAYPNLHEPPEKAETIIERMKSKLKG